MARKKENPLEWTLMMTIFSSGGGPKRHVVGTQKIKVLYRQATTEKGRDYAKVEEIRGWPFSAGHQDRRKELTTKFNTEVGMQLRNLETAINRANAERITEEEKSNGRNPTAGFRFKSCPRCQGDVKRSSDIYGAYQQCLQCGWMNDLERSAS